MLGDQSIIFMMERHAGNEPFNREQLDVREAFNVELEVIDLLFFDCTALERQNQVTLGLNILICNAIEINNVDWL